MNEMIIPLIVTVVSAAAGMLVIWLLHAINRNWNRSTAPNRLRHSLAP